MKWWTGALIASACFVGLVLVLFGLLRKLEADQLFVLEQRMQDTAIAITPMAMKLASSQDISAVDRALLQESLVTTQNATGSRIRVLNSNRDLVADSLMVDPAEQNQLRFRPEIQSAFTGHYGAYTRNSDETPRSLALFVALPLDEQGEKGGVVYVSHSTDDILQQLGVVRRAANRGVIVLASAVLMLALVVTGRLRGTLSRLGSLTKNVGELEVQEIPISGDDDVAEIGQNFNRLILSLRSKVEQLEEERKKTKLFLEDVAHELKTPITGLAGSVESLRIGHLDESVRDRLLSNVERETARLSELTSRLMELQKVEYETLRLENFDVISVAETVLDTFQRVAEKAEVELTLESCEVLSAHGDLKKIQRVLENLVENAIRCSSPSTRVQIKLRQDENSAWIGVRDQGPGPPDISLFQRNHQGEAFQGSLGLGLSIASEILRKHGQELKVEAGEESGSVFSFSLEAVH